MKLSNNEKKIYGYERKGGGGAGGRWMVYQTSRAKLELCGGVGSGGTPQQSRSSEGLGKSILP